MYSHGSIEAGKPDVLGATPGNGGVNFAVHAGLPATKVELCLFHPESGEERIELKAKDNNNIFHGFVPGLEVGVLYGYRVHGPWNPQEGHVFNGHKLLLDPYAKAIEGKINWADGVVHGYRINPDYPGSPDHDLIMDTRDSAAFMPKGRVIDWQGYIECAKEWREEMNIPDGSIYRPEQLAIMEVHIKGATKQHPQLSQGEHGTYKSLTNPSFTDLIRGGINMVELMPVHSFPPIESTGKTNFWGYMTLNYFTPNNYSMMSDPLQGFVNMVQDLRKKGIEVMMDVVYNHTAEGNHMGPTLSLKGFDSFIYRHVQDNKRFYYDTTGCGNSLDFNHPMARRLVVDSLEYFAQLGVTGFRFDLGVALGREGEHGSYNPQAQLFKDIQASPILAGKVHFTGEPWDLGQGDSYQLGNTPAFRAWNGKYRDYVSDFALSGSGGDPAMLSKFLTGSPHIFGRPTEGINFITAHDGHTLADKAALGMGYTQDELKDPEAFKARLREDPKQLEIFQTRQQFAIALLALSVGTPMIPFGHGRGHSQHGNHDAYDKDDPSTWVKWVLGDDEENMLDRTKEIFELRKRHPELSRDTFFSGEVNPDTGKKDITFYNPNGTEMQMQDWQNGQAFAYRISGQKITDDGPGGKPVYNPDLLVFINGGHEAVTFKMPDIPEGVAVQSFNSSHMGGHVTEPSKHECGSEITIAPRALTVLESGIRRSIDMQKERGQVTGTSVA